MKWRLTSIAIDRISVTGPSSKHDMKDIEHKADKMEDGKEVKPVVLVDPGEDGLLQVADGHHRVTAAVLAKKMTLPAFVGVPQRDDDWRREIMDMQLARATKNFSLGMTGSSEVALTPFDLEPGAQRLYPAPTPPGSLLGRKVRAAGIAMVAADTGRVLMIQRALDPDDPHGGKWEFPGGHLEDDETVLDAAVREFQEETGIALPEGIMVAAVPSANGIYMLHVHVVTHEDEVPINLEHHHRRKNPDDPDGDMIEVAAWWSVPDARSNPALRDECKSSPWDIIAEAPRRALAVASN
jgi:8-oxo-dGTP pyrophosphatase MutT (NUDIX family)